MDLLTHRESLAGAADRAVHALLDAQGTDGRWLDFPQVGRGSDEWVTGYVGAIVAPHAPDAGRRAWEAMCRRQRWTGGWGFMPSYPPDADSSACALRLAERVGEVGSMRARRGRVFLAGHQRANGGISTYRWPRRMIWHTRLRESFAGWCATHVCVSANAARLQRFGGRGGVLDFLVRSQQADGSWRAYWWDDECEYATAFAVEALATSAVSEHRAAVERAIAWAGAESRRDGCVRTAAAPEGSAFATALRVRVLASAADGEWRAERRTLAEWLIEAQRPDGLWPASAWLRFPPTDVIDTTTIAEWHVGSMVRAGVMSDGRALFTTATVLDTFDSLLARETDSRDRTRLQATASH